MIEPKDIDKFAIGIKKMVGKLVRNKGYSSGFPIAAAFLKENFNFINANVNSRFVCHYHKKSVQNQNTKSV